MAFATIVSWMTSCVLALSALWKNEGVVKLKSDRIRFYRQEMVEVLFIGIPAGLQQALYSIANVIITATVNSFGALSAIFSAQLSSIMSSDPAVIAYSQQKMVIISSTYFICGINEIMGAALKGMGKPVVTTVATLMFMCALRFVWVYLIFPLCPNLTFLYLVWPIGWILSIIMLLFFYFMTVKKLFGICANAARQN